LAIKDAKDYHWAMIEITPDDTPDGQDDGHAMLLLRPHRYTGTVGYYVCWSPRPVPLARLIAVAVTRWRIFRHHAILAAGVGTAANGDCHSLRLRIVRLAALWNVWSDRAVSKSH
jgi:hypothetical protein